MAYNLKNILSKNSYQLIDMFVSKGTDAISLMGYKDIHPKQSILSMFQALADPKFVNAREKFGTEVGTLPFQKVDEVSPYIGKKFNSFALKGRDFQTGYTRFPLKNNYMSPVDDFEDYTCVNYAKILKNFERAFSIDIVEVNDPVKLVSSKSGLKVKSANILSKLLTPIVFVKDKLFYDFNKEEVDRIDIGSNKMGTRSRVYISKNYLNKNLSNAEKIVALVDFWSKRANNHVAKQHSKLSGIKNFSKAEQAKIVFASQLLTNITLCMAFDMGTENNRQVDNALRLQLANTIASMESDLSIEIASKNAHVSTYILMKKLGISLDKIINNKKKLGIEYLQKPNTIYDVMFAKTKNNNFVKNAKNEIEYNGESKLFNSLSKNLDQELNLTAPTQQTKLEPEQKSKEQFAPITKEKEIERGLSNVNEVETANAAEETSKPEVIPDESLFEDKNTIVPSKQTAPITEEKEIESETISTTNTETEQEVDNTKNYLSVADKIVDNTKNYLNIMDEIEESKKDKYLNLINDIKGNVDEIEIDEIKEDSKDNYLDLTETIDKALKIPSNEELNSKYYRLEIPKDYQTHLSDFKDEIIPEQPKNNQKTLSDFKDEKISQQIVSENYKEQMKNFKEQMKNFEQSTKDFNNSKGSQQIVYKNYVEQMKNFKEQMKNFEQSKQNVETIKEEQAPKKVTVRQLTKRTPRKNNKTNIKKVNHSKVVWVDAHKIKDDNSKQTKVTDYVNIDNNQTKLENFNDNKVEEIKLLPKPTIKLLTQAKGQNVIYLPDDSEKLTRYKLLPQNRTPLLTEYKSTEQNLPQTKKPSSLNSKKSSDDSSGSQFIKKPTMILNETTKKMEVVNLSNISSQFLKQKKAKKEDLEAKKENIRNELYDDFSIMMSDVPLSPEELNAKREETKNIVKGTIVNASDTKSKQTPTKKTTRVKRSVRKPEAKIYKKKVFKQNCYNCKNCHSKQNCNYYRILTETEAKK